ncbi:hypothetical protein BJ508DRAFT_380263, partial [Ascobolus immersus RN42]
MSRLPVTLPTPVPNFRQCLVDLVKGGFISTYIRRRDRRSLKEAIAIETTVIQIFDGGFTTNNWFNGLDLSHYRANGLNPDALHQVHSMGYYRNPQARAAEEPGVATGLTSSFFSPDILEVIRQNKPVRSHVHLLIHYELNVMLTARAGESHSYEYMGSWKFPRMFIPVMEEFILFLHNTVEPFIGTHWDDPEYLKEAQG